MAKRKGTKDNGQKKRDEGQWPKEKGRRTMAKRKGTKDNGQKKRDEEQWPKEKGRRDKQ